MTLSYTSPDETSTVKQVTVNGKSYDLPPWIAEREFVDGLTSKNSSEPLASLVSCELVEWQLLDHYEDEKYYPYFKVEFFLPFGSIREFALDRFSLATESDGDFLVDAELTSEGAIVKYLGMEPLNLYAVAAYLIPKDLDKVPEFSDTANNTVSSLIPEREYFEEILEDASNGSDDIYKELVGPNGEPYILLVQEDMD